MKSASNRILNRLVFPFVDEDIEVVANLRVVAKAFAQLQAKRHTADYDNITFWTRKEALEQVKLAQQAFVKWNLIRDEDIARTFLISLLAKSRG